jgi:hypothetical protein
MKQRPITLATFLGVAILCASLACGLGPDAVPTSSGGGLAKSSKNPLLTEGESGSWMVLKADPVVIKDGGTYKLPNCLSVSRLRRTHKPARYLRRETLKGDVLKIWYVGVGRQGSWYPELTRGFQYQIGYAEQNTFD